MLKAFFSVHNPLFYPVLLVAVVALRWASFDSASAGPAEQVIWAAAERVASGQPLYAEAWVRHPPVVPAVAALAYALFGPVGWAVLQALSVVAIVASALVLNWLFSSYRVTGEATALPGFLLALCLATPTGSLPAMPELGLILPCLLLLRLLLAELDASRPHPRALLAIGALAMAILLIDFRGGFVVLGLLLAAALAKPPQLASITTVVGGALSVALGTGVLLWALGIFDDFRALALEGAWQLWWQAPEPTAADPLRVATLWGPLIALAVVGVMGFRGRLGGGSARLRQAEAVMAVWFAAGLLLLVAEMPGLRLATVSVLSVPVAFYAVNALSSGVLGRFRWGVVGVVSAALLLPHLWSALPVNPPDAASRWPLSAWAAPPREQPSDTLRRWAQALPPGATLWVIDAQPALGAQLGLPPGTRYLDLGLYDQLVGAQLQTDPKVGVPARSLEELFRALRQAPPTAVIDRSGRFDELGQALPLQVGEYTRQTVGPWQAYRLRRRK